MHAARSASGWRESVQPVVGLGDAPQPGQCFADDAVAATARHGRAAHERAPRTGLLGDPAHLRAEQAGLPAGVGELGRGERLAVVALGERDGLGQSVGHPVVGDRRPVVLDIVATRGEVVADAICDLPEALVGEQEVEPGERPVRLARVVLRAALELRCHVDGVVLGDHGAVLERLAGHEAAEAEQQLVVGLVPGQQPTLGEAGGEQRRPADGCPPVRGQRSPVVVLDEVALRPRQPAVGALEGAVDAGGRGLVEAHDAAGVAHEVVVVGCDLAGGVVLVQPAAVVALVAHEPLHGVVGGLVQRLGRRLRGSARAARRRRT